MSGQHPQGWQQPSDPYGTQPTVPIQPTDPYGYQPTQPVQPTDPYGQQWNPAAVVPAQQPTPGYAPGYAPAYAPVAYAVVPAQRMNTLALVGFILSLIGIPVAPIIMGHIARKQIRTSGESGDGFALAAIIIGYVVAALLAALVIYWIVMAVVFFGLLGAMVSSGY